MVYKDEYRYVGLCEANAGKQIIAPS